MGVTCEIYGKDYSNRSKGFKDSQRQGAGGGTQHEASKKCDTKKNVKSFTSPPKCLLSCWKELRKIKIKHFFL